MSKILNKTVKKATLLSIVLAVILVVALVLTRLLGVNYASTVDNAKTLTVTGGYFTETQLGELQEVCETEFEKQGVEVLYAMDGGRVGADNEIVYVFAENTDLTAVKTALDATFAGEAWSDAVISVRVASDIVNGAKIPSSYLAWAGGAIVLFAVLTFAYVSLRYRLNMGIVSGISVLVGVILSVSVLLLCRIPLNNSSLYAVAVSSLLSAVFTLFTFNKIRENFQSEASKSQKSEEVVAQSFATKETLLLTATLGVALIVVGAFGTVSVRWFALSSLVTLIASAFVGLVYAPALYLSFKKVEDKKAEGKTASGYVGAKPKTAKAEKVEKTEEPTPASEEPKEEPKEEVKEEPAPVEETVEEPTPVEEPVAETTEEPAPVEEAQEESESSDEN